MTVHLIMQGGSWFGVPDHAKVASRDDLATIRGYRNLGFRLVRRRS